MPFCADTRCGVFQVSLNVYSIHEEISDYTIDHQELDMEYFGELDNEEGSVFYKYVYDLENDYNKALNSNPQTCPKFWDWFYDNYNSIESWEDVVNETIALKIRDRETEDFISYLSWAMDSSGVQLFCSGTGCEYSNYCEGATKQLCLYHEKKYLCEECGGDMDIEDEEQEDMFLPNSPSPIPNPPSPSPPSPNLTYQDREDDLEVRLSQVPERSVSPPHTVREPKPQKHTLSTQKKKKIYKFIFLLVLWINPSIYYLGCRNLLLSVVGNTRQKTQRNREDTLGVNTTENFKKGSILHTTKSSKLGKP